MNLAQKDTQIVFICQPGNLLLKSLLLAYSLEQHTRLEKYVCIPEQFQNRIPTTVLNVFKVLNTHIKYFNNAFIAQKKAIEPGDWMSNKFYALQLFNQENNLLFLDSDIICLQDINLPKSNFDFAAKPADFSTQANWELLFNEFSTKATGRVTHATVEITPSPPYFNSGVLWLGHLKFNQFLSDWMATFMALSKDNGATGQYDMYHRDQIAFTLAIEKLNLGYLELTETHNFPARRRDELSKKTIFAHYHDVFTIHKHQRLRAIFEKFMHEFPEVSDLYNKSLSWKWLHKNAEIRLMLYQKFIGIKRRISKFKNQFQKA